MENILLKTTIKCSGCIAAVTPTLDNMLGAGNWSVDTSAPERLLSVPKADVSAAEVVAALNKLGYKAEPIG